MVKESGRKTGRLKYRTSSTGRSPENPEFSRLVPEWNREHRSMRGAPGRSVHTLPFAKPEFHHQQSPEPAFIVAATGVMLLEQIADELRGHQVTCDKVAASQVIPEKRS